MCVCAPKTLSHSVLIDKIPIILFVPTYCDSNKLKLTLLYFLVTPTKDKPPHPLNTNCSSPRGIRLGPLWQAWVTSAVQKLLLYFPFIYTTGYCFHLICSKCWCTFLIELFQKTFFFLRTLCSHPHVQVNKLKVRESLRRKTRHPVLPETILVCDCGSGVMCEAPFSLWEVPEFG